MILIGRAEERELLEFVGEKKGSVVSYFGYVREMGEKENVRGMISRERENAREIMEGIEREIREKFPVEETITLIVAD